MSRIWADFVNFGKQYTRSKVGMFFAFAFPVLLILLFGAIFASGDVQKTTLSVQNLDDGPYSLMFMEILNSTETANLEMIPDGESILQYIEDESLSVALVIPAGFSEQVAEIAAGNQTGLANLVLYGDPSRTTFGTVSATVGMSTVNMNYVLTASTPIVAFDMETIGSEEFEYIDFFLPGVVGIVVMTNSLYSMTSVCGEYKSRGYFKLLATTSIRKHEWLLSKFAFYTVLLWASLILTFIIGKLAFDMHAMLTPLAFLFIAAGAFLFTSLGMVLGIVIKDPESSTAVANAVGFPMMFLSGAFWPVEAMPAYLQAVAKAIPLTYINDGLRDTMVYANNESALVNMAIVVVLSVVFFVLGSRLMSWKER